MHWVSLGVKYMKYPNCTFAFQYFVYNKKRKIQDNCFMVSGYFFRKYFRIFNEQI